MCMMIKQLTGAVGGGGNPFAPSPGGGAMVVQTGYKANFLGQDVVFADEAQYLKVKFAYEQKIGKGGAPTDGSEESGEGLLGTMGKALPTVAAFLNGRNLQTKIEDLDDALDAQKAARAELAALPPGATMGDLMPKLLKYLDAEREATELAQAALEDQVLAEDIRVGGGVAQLIQSFTKGGGGSFGGSNFGTAAAVGIGGLGLASMFSRSDRRNSRR
jgi:hypothetical protein